MAEPSSDNGLASCPPVLDLEHLAKYTAGDAGLQAELLALFSDQLAQQLEALRKQCQHQDWIMATHTLKGAARAIGAFQIAETAEELEQLDPREQPEVCAQLINKLLRQSDECKAAIRTLSEAA